MSRELKFRVLDGEVMRYPSSDTVITFFNGYGLVKWAMCQRIGGARVADSEYESVIMQYTGVKDKNGRDIYEGDVVRYPGSTVEDHLMSVVFRRGAFELRQSWQNESPFLGTSGQSISLAEEFEVIGNVFEHGHLLKNGN